MRDIQLILVNVRSAQNVGSIFRSADAFGITKIWIAGYTPTPDLDLVKKTSLGAEASVTWERVVDPIACFERVRAEGRAVYALECGVESAVPLADASGNDPIAIVLGNEVEGLSRIQIARCDGILEIPMRGVKESLNVAVAAGIAMWELSRKRDS